jgi:hypothetical protein
VPHLISYQPVLGPAGYHRPSRCRARMGRLQCQLHAHTIHWLPRVSDRLCARRLSNCTRAHHRRDTLPPTRLFCTILRLRDPRARFSCTHSR